MHPPLCGLERSLKPVLRRPDHDTENDGLYAFRMAYGGPHWRDAADTKAGLARNNLVLGDLRRKELGIRLVRYTEGQCGQQSVSD